MCPCNRCRHDDDAVLRQTRAKPSIRGPMRGLQSLAARARIAGTPHISRGDPRVSTRRRYHARSSVRSAGDITSAGGFRAGAASTSIRNDAA